MSNVVNLASKRNEKRARRVIDELKEESLTLYYEQGINLVSTDCLSFFNSVIESIMFSEEQENVTVDIPIIAYSKDTQYKALATLEFSMGGIELIEEN